MFKQLEKVPTWALIAAGVAVAYIVFKPNQVGQSIGGAVGGIIFEGTGGLIEGVTTAAGNKLSPTSKNNFIYDDIIGGFGRGATGNKEWNLGDAIYDLIHGD